MRFDRGVDYYTSGTAHIRVHFPEDAVCCRYCPHCYDDRIGRYFCRLTGRMIYVLDQLGYGCPVELDVNPDTGEVKEAKA